MLKSGDKAPDFCLESDEGKQISLKDFQGERIVLYFYPKDNTPSCTTEGMEFSMMYSMFGAKGVQIIGVSPDDIQSHKYFKDQHKLKITLLSDTDHKVATSYFAYGEKKNYGKTYMGIIRSTFIIEDGVILDALYNVKAPGHAEKIYAKLEKLINERN